MNIESISKYFYNRYQNYQNYKHLYHNETVLSQEISSLFQIDYNELSDEEKLKIMLFVIYRYRNNIFHGNKGVLSWTKYTEKIDKCLKFVMSLIDCVKNHSEE